MVSDRGGVNVGISRLFINIYSEGIDNKSAGGKGTRKLCIDSVCGGISPLALMALPVTTQ